TGVRRIGADQAKAKAGDGTGSVNVTVAIIDTGIQLKHPDLNVTFNKSFFSGASSGDDEHGHGTHCAGIVGAKDDGVGVVGVAPGAKLWALRVFDDDPSGPFASDSDVIAALNFVAGKASQ